MDRTLQGAGCVTHGAAAAGSARGEREGGVARRGARRKRPLCTVGRLAVVGAVVASASGEEVFGNKSFVAELPSGNLTKVRCRTVNNVGWTAGSAFTCNKNVWRWEQGCYNGSSSENAICQDQTLFQEHECAPIDAGFVPYGALDGEGTGNTDGVADYKFWCPIDQVYDRADVDRRKLWIYCECTQEAHVPTVELDQLEPRGNTLSSEAFYDENVTIDTTTVEDELEELWLSTFEDYPEEEFRNMLFEDLTEETSICLPYAANPNVTADPFNGCLEWPSTPEGIQLAQRVNEVYAATDRLTILGWCPTKQFNGEFTMGGPCSLNYTAFEVAADYPGESVQPTQTPTFAPTTSPTPSPSYAPTLTPIQKITLSPTLAPTSAPTQSTFDSWTGSVVVGFSNPESSANFNLTHSLRCHMKLVMSEDVQKTVFPGDNLDVAGDLKIKNLNRDLDGSELVPFTNLGKCVTLASPIRGLSKFCLLNFVLVQNSQIRITDGPTASPSRPPTLVQTKSPTVPVMIAPTKAPSFVSPTKGPTVVSSPTTPTIASPTVPPTLPTSMPTKAPTLGPVTASPTKQLVTLYQYLEALFVRKESPLYATSLFLPTSSKERALQRKSPQTVKLVFPGYLGEVAGDLGLDSNATAEEMFERLFYRSRTRIPTRKNEPTDDATELVCFVESTTPSPEDISPPNVDGGVSDLGPESWEVIVGSVLGFLCLVGFFCSVWCYSLRKPRLQDQSSQYTFGKSLDKDGPSEFRLLSSGKHSKSGSKWNLGPSQVAMDDIGTESMDDLQIELNNLTLGPVIGNGANGRIFKASYCGSDVAVKELFPRGGMNKRGFGKERTSSRLGNFRNYSSNATNTSTASSSTNLDTLLQNHTLLGDRSSSTQHASSSSASVGTIYEADSTITELSVSLANKSMLPRRKSMPKHAISEETVHSLPNNGLGIAENLREGMQSFSTAPPSPIALSLDVGSGDLPPPKLPPRPVQVIATSSRLTQRHSSASSLTSAHTDVDGLRHVDHALHEVLNEVKNLRLLRHPNIIQLFGCAKAKSNDTGGLRYLVVMELAACSLMDLILRTPKSQNLTFKDFPLERKLSVARQVAAGCAFIHENNLIHFDIKPENILLDAAGNAKICDLGIAKLSHGPEHSTESAQCGTPAYMAPELLGEVRNVTNKIDVYSYGLVLWQILHGRYCHPPTWSVPRLFFEVRNNHYRPPFDPLLRVDSALFDLVRKAWHDDPAERPEFHSIVRELDEIEADRGAGSVTQSLRRTAFSPGDEVGLWDYQQRQYMAAQVVSIDSEAQVATVELTGVTSKVVRTGVPIAEILPRQRIAGANLLHSVSGLARIHGGIRNGIRPASELALNEKAAVLPPVALMSLRFVDIAAPQSGHDTGQSSLSSTSLDVKNGSQYNMAKTFMFSDRVLEVKGFRLTEKGVESSTAIENGPVTRETGKDSKREGPGSLVPRLPGPSTDVEVKPIKETLFKIGDLGRGVSGAVYAALHLPTFKLFAVKEVRFSDRGARHQAVRELNALYGQLSGESGSAQRCPNIVFLHHAYLDPDSTSVCLVMEYLDGGSLQDLLSRALAASIQPPAPSPPAGVQTGKAKFKMAFSSPVGFLERAETDHASHVGEAEDSVFKGVEMASTGICYEPTLALIARSVLKAIAHLHARQMLHLDIKPANILINSRGEVKLADFGLSRQLEAAGEHFASTFVGTLKYMSPERLRGEVYSYPCDIFSFALTMLTVTLGHFPDELLSTTNTGDKESNATANLTGSSHGGLYPEDIPKHGSATYWQLHERWSSGKPLTLPERLIHKSPFKLNEGSTADTSDKQFAGSETEVVNLSEEFRDFLEHGLRLDPSMRPTAEELLNHSWLTQVEDSVQSEFNNSFHQEAAMNLLQDVAFSLMSKARTDAQLREKIGPVVPGSEGAIVTVDERKVVTLADQLLLPVDVVKRTFVVASSENNATKGN